MELRYWLGACLLLSGAAGACTYDQADQLEKLRELARTVDGATLDEGEKSVRWKDAEGRMFAVVYGGCDHLGLKVSRTEPVGAELPEAELFEVAAQLGRIPAWSTEYTHLERAIETGGFTREAVDGRVRYDIAGTDYSEMYVESERAGKFSVISFGWVRDF